MGEEPKRRVAFGINFKFTLLILLATVGFLAAAYYVSFGVMRSFALQTAEEAARTVLDGTDSRVRSLFDNFESLARGLVANSAVRNIDEHRMKDLFITTVLAWKRYVRSIYLGTTDGKMREWGFGPEFKDYVPTFPPDYDPRNRPWYRAALESAGFAVTAPYRFASVDAPGITCAIRATDDRGRTIGVLGIDMLLDDVRNILTDHNIPRRGSALILSAELKVIAASSDTAAGKDAARFETADFRGRFTESEGKFRIKIGERDTLVYYRKSEPIGWYLLVGLPYDRVMTSVRQTLSLLSAAEILLMALLTIALAVISNRLISAPLHRMAKVINRIESGDRDARIEIRSNDEFALLGREFNKLVAAAGEYSSSLESKVKQRTEKLRTLQRENTRLRITEERRRIYRDMHDSIGAKLTNIFFCNNVARSAVDLNPEKLEGLFDDIERNCAGAVQDLKEIIGGLRGARHGAEPFLEALADEIGSRLASGQIGFSCRDRTPDEASALNAQAKDELRKVFDELTSNALKHSGARKVGLTIDLAGDSYRFAFKDNGKGIDLVAAAGKGEGLANIEFRVRRLGGTLSVAAKPGKGTVFTLLIPSDAKARRNPA